MANMPRIGPSAPPATGRGAKRRRRGGQLQAARRGSSSSSSSDPPIHVDREGAPEPAPACSMASSSSHHASNVMLAPVLPAFLRIQHRAASAPAKEIDAAAAAGAAAAAAAQAASPAHLLQAMKRVHRAVAIPPQLRLQLQLQHQRQLEFRAAAAARKLKGAEAASLAPGETDSSSRSGASSGEEELEEEVLEAGVEDRGASRARRQPAMLPSRSDVTAGPQLGPRLALQSAPAINPAAVHAHVSHSSLPPVPVHVAMGPRAHVPFMMPADVPWASVRLGFAS
eukprot:tig00000792_g4171.t1